FGVTQTARQTPPPARPNKRTFRRLVRRRPRPGGVDGVRVGCYRRAATRVAEKWSPPAGDEPAGNRIRLTIAPQRKNTGGGPPKTRPPPPFVDGTDESLLYSTSVDTAGTYRLDFRVASNDQGGKFHRNRRPKRHRRPPPHRHARSLNPLLPLYTGGGQ